MPNPEAGEWTVHVGGWLVPQAPQAYTLAGAEFTGSVVDGELNVKSLYLPLILKNRG